MSKKEVPNYEQLRRLAIERHEIAKHALSQKWYNSAMGDYHMSLELLMKSAVYKHGGTPPTSSVKGHDLVEISKASIVGAPRGMKNLHKAITADRTVVTLWTNINSAWDTSKRYKYLQLDPLDIDDLADAYERIFVWILTNYVE